MFRSQVQSATVRHRAQQPSTNYKRSCLFCAVGKTSVASFVKFLSRCIDAEDSGQKDRSRSSIADWVPCSLQAEIACIDHWLRRTCAIFLPILNHEL